MPESQANTLFADKEGMFGKRLGKEQRDAILSYLNAPSLSGWEEIRGYLITPLFTLWQALSEQSSNTPSLGSEFNESNIPTREELETLLVDAVHLHNLTCRRRINEIENELRRLSDTPELSLAKG
jgi:hypothetical protein